MLNVVSGFIMMFIYNIFYCYIYAKLTNNKMIKLNKKNLLICLLLAVPYCISLLFSVQLIIILFRIAFTMILLKKLYNENISKTLITTFLIYLLLAIGEFLFVILFIIILKIDKSFFQSGVLGIACSNILILGITIILSKDKIIRKILSNIIKWCTNNNFISNIILIALAAIIIFACTIYNYQNVESNEVFILVNLFFIGIIVFIIGYFKEKTNNNKLVSEYDNLIDYVKTYEELLESKNKNQHEYVNQLILIKSMLPKNNKQAKEYIDRLLDIEENSEENIWINKFKNIPNGGLKGLLYYKISDMVKNNINVYIEISDSVNNKKLNKYLNDNLEDISKIIGVYLDNAKDAIIESDKRYLILEAECDKERFNLSISNTYKGNINLSKLDEEGYSKKGKGRGYGLSLVKDIISRRKDVMQSREMNGMYFVQTVTFNYKKK